METDKTKILSLTPDRDTLLDMINLAFRDDDIPNDPGFTDRAGVISAAMAFFVANRVIDRPLTSEMFRAVGITNLSDDEFKFSRWLLLISGHPDLEDRLTEIFR